MRASESDRAVVCPASLVLPRAAQTTGDGARYGTLAHHWKETGETDPAWGDVRDITALEKKLVLSGTRREDWWSGGWHEVTFALHLRDVLLKWWHPTLNNVPREDLGDRETWKAAHDPKEWLTGTIDYLGLHGWVDDLKTGRWPVDPRTSRQLRSYALVPWVREGRPGDWEGVVSITQWPKYPLAATPRRTAAILTALDLNEHLMELQWAVDHPEEINPTPEGCRFCASRLACPEGAGASAGEAVDEKGDG